MTTITSDQITSAVITKIMKDISSDSLISEESYLNAHIETELRKEPAKDSMTKLILAYAFTSSRILKEKVPLNSVTVNIAVNFMTIGIALGLHLAKELVDENFIKENKEAKE